MGNRSEQSLYKGSYPMVNRDTALFPVLSLCICCDLEISLSGEITEIHAYVYTNTHTHTHS